MREMMVKEEKKEQKYTCNEYREEMILASCMRRLQNDNLSEAEREKLLKEITFLQQRIGL